MYKHELKCEIENDQFTSTVDNYVINLIEVTYGHAQYGEPCHRRLERTDTSDDYSLSLSHRSNPRSVHKDILIRKELLFEGQTAK